MKKWEQILAGVAPTVATALGGPLAGTAVKFLAQEFLGDESASEDQLSAAIMGANAEQLSKIKQIDNDFKVKMKSLDVDVLKISADNTKSARDMAKITMVPQIALSVIFISGYFILLGMMFDGYISPSETMKDPLLLLLGVMTREVPTIMQFWFGSSLGSKVKTEHMSGKV